MIISMVSRVEPSGRRTSYFLCIETDSKAQAQGAVDDFHALGQGGENVIVTHEPEVTAHRDRETGRITWFGRVDFVQNNNNPLSEFEKSLFPVFPARELSPKGRKGNTDAR